MRNVTISSSGSLLLLVLVFSCQHEKAAALAKTVIVGDRSISKTGGTDCDKADTLRFDCLEINLSYPEVQDGSEALKKSVSDWSNLFLTSLLLPYLEEGAAKPTNAEAAADTLTKQHEVCIKENPGSPACSWSAFSEHKTRLNDGKYLTLEIEASSFMGGAHGIALSSIATFDVQTGKQLTLADLVTDTAAFKTLAEKSFRATRKDVFQPEDGSEPMEFGDIFPFAVPQNFGLTEDGIYCHYNPYEVGPYAIGSTQFTISFEELGALSKIQPPSQPTGSSEPVIDLYEVNGDSVVIPPFEIEVSNSPKADQLLAKQG